METEFSNVLLIQAAGDGTEGLLQDLNVWLRSEREFTATKTSIEATDERGTHQGLLSVILLVLGTKAAIVGVEKLGEALIAWIKARRPRTVITIRDGSREVKIDATNPPSLEELMRELKKLLPETQPS